MRNYGEEYEVIGLLLTNKIRSAFKTRHLMRNKRLKNFAERLIFSEISISFGEISIISESERTLTWIIPISLFFPLFSPILVILGFYVSLPSHVSTASGHIGHMGHFFSG